MLRESSVMWTLERRCCPRTADIRRNTMTYGAQMTSETKNPRPAGLDEVDLAILAELATNARITGAALAKRVGVAESTCAKRVQLLRDRGVITGFTTQLDLAALGRPIQAVIAVQLASHNRDHVLRFH